MNIKGKVHCFFEQSGTFKNEFIKLGIQAEDYDIQNNFGQTDHVTDLFKAIEDAYDEKPSLFDAVTKDDLIMAFFPCVYFESCSMMLMSLGDLNYRRLTDAQKLNAILERAAKREMFYELLIKMVGVCILRGLRIVFENPWAMQHFLKQGNFLKSPSVIDNNRTLRGDVYVKPTAYWFFNCEPTRGNSRQVSKVKKTIRSIAHPAKFVNGQRMCCEERSEIHPDYARNFICDFILGGGADRSSATVGYVRRIGKEGGAQMTIDNDTRRYILDRLTAIREAANGKKPGKKERAVLRAVREIEEVVK